MQTESLVRRSIAPVLVVTLAIAIPLVTVAAAPSGAPSASAEPSAEPSGSARPSETAEPSESARPSDSIAPSESVAPSEPTSRDARIRVSTVITTDGSFWEEVTGWQYSVVVTNGSTDHDAVTSGGPFRVTVAGELATVRITETLQGGLKLHRASCMEPDPESYEGHAFGTLDGATLSFDVKPGGEYTCEFVNGPRVQPDAQVWIWKAMDADGDWDTPEDFPVGVGWDFSIDVTNGSASRAEVTTDNHGVASFTVSAFAHLEITEVDGSDLLAGDCWDILGEDPIHGGYTQDGATLAFDTEPGGVYGCQFTNLGVGVEGEVVLAPPTDTLGDTPEPSSDSRRLVFILLAGLIAGVLVLKSPRSRA